MVYLVVCIKNSPSRNKNVFPWNYSVSLLCFTMIWIVKQTASWVTEQFDNDDDNNNNNWFICWSQIRQLQHTFRRPASSTHWKLNVWLIPLSLLEVDGLLCNPFCLKNQTTVESLFWHMSHDVKRCWKLRISNTQSTWCPENSWQYVTARP